MGEYATTHALHPGDEWTTRCGIKVMQSGAGDYYRERPRAKKVKPTDRQIHIRRLVKPTCGNCKRGWSPHA